MTKAKLLAAWKSISVGQGIALAGVCGAVAYVVARLPPGTVEAIAAKDPVELGIWVGGVLLAVGGVFTRARSEP